MRTASWGLRPRIRQTGHRGCTYGNGKSCSGCSNTTQAIGRGLHWTIHRVTFGTTGIGCLLPALGGAERTPSRSAEQGAAGRQAARTSGSWLTTWVCRGSLDAYKACQGILLSQSYKECPHARRNIHRRSHRPYQPARSTPAVVPRPLIGGALGLRAIPSARQLLPTMDGRPAGGLEDPPARQHLIDWLACQGIGWQPCAPFLPGWMHAGSYWGDMCLDIPCAPEDPHYRALQAHLQPPGSGHRFENVTLFHTPLANALLHA